MLPMIPPGMCFHGDYLVCSLAAGVTVAAVCFVVFCSSLIMKACLLLLKYYVACPEKAKIERKKKIVPVIF